MNIGSKKVLEKNNFKLGIKMKSEIIYKGKRLQFVLVWKNFIIRIYINSSHSISFN